MYWPQVRRLFKAVTLTLETRLMTHLWLIFFYKINLLKQGFPESPYVEPVKYIEVYVRPPATGKIFLTYRLLSSYMSQGSDVFL